MANTELEATRAITLFIVEDDLHFRETFIDVMSLRGVDTFGAGSAGEALFALRTMRPSVIILDVKLPDIHGFELCRRLRRFEHLQKVPIIMISASTQYNDPRDRVEGVLAGAALFLSKPITMDQLWSENESLLG